MTTQRKMMGLGLCVMYLFMVSSVLAVPISINNYGFESPVLGDNGWSAGTPSGWVVDGASGYTVGVWNPPASPTLRFTGCEGNGTSAGGDGANVLLSSQKLGYRLFFF